MKDVFLSHASQDKEQFVLPFARELDRAGISYWLDEAEIRWGEKIGARINDGLNASRFVIVFLTPTFVGRNWAETELSTALTRENDEGRTVVLPIITENPNRLLSNYPFLRDKSYRKWDDGLVSLVNQLTILLDESRNRFTDRLRTLVQDRMAGKRRVANSLQSIVDGPRSELSDFARLELAIHEFSRLREINAYPEIVKFHNDHIEEPLVKRGLGVLETLCLLCRDDFRSAARVLQSTTSVPLAIEQHRHYFALQELIAFLALRRRGNARQAWDVLSGRPPRMDENLYPFTLVVRDFARALLAVLVTAKRVHDILGNLPVSDHRGVAHFTAVTARCARKTRPILEEIESWGVDENWATQHNTRDLGGRLHSFEKALLSVSGSLFRA